MSADMTKDIEKESLPDAMEKAGSLRHGEVQDVKLNQNFNIWSTLGVTFSFVATPLSIGSFLSFSLSAGGSAYFLYGYITAFFFNTLVALSLAEMAGFLPHPSGQIFWTSQLAPPRYARVVSYFDGAFTTLAWILWTAGTWLFATQILMAFIKQCGAAWIQESYQTFLIYTAYGLFALVFNTWGFKLVPFLSKCMIGFINAGSLFILIALVVRSSPKPSARQVFVDVINETGWTSDGLVFLINLLPGVTAINGFDSAAHLAEEVPQPAKHIPRVMIGTVLLCGFSGLPMVIAFLFSITDAEKLLSSAQPVLQLLYDSLDSMPLFVIGGLIYVGLFTFASGSILTTSSRVWWSFARSGAVPFPKWQGRVNESWKLPINTIIVVVAINVLIGLFIFGPATVLTGLVGSAAICFCFSYAIPILCFLIRGRKGLPAKRYFNLGWYGPIINLVSVVWSALVPIFLCFPIFWPVTTDLMNYASVVVAIGFLFWVVVWITYGRNNYKAPSPLDAEELHSPVG
ncbi:putative amino acid transporter [Ilyonectria destructans]|nr:putative amino acid transporter [Ilyonectria destructans]